MKITAKLIISYLTMVLLLIIVGIYATIALSHINENGVRMYEERVISMNNVAYIGKTAENTRVNMLSSVLRENTSFVDTAEKNLEKIQNHINHYRTQPMSTEERAIFEEFEKNWSDFSEIVKDNISLVRSGKFPEASAGLVRGGVPFTLASENLESLVQINLRVAENLMIENNQEFSKTRKFMVIILVIAILLSIGIGTIAGKIFSTPLKKVCEKANQIAQGDLTGGKLDVRTKDEFGELSQSFNFMTDNLRHIIGTVQKASEETAATSEELAASSEEVTAGIDEIAISTQDVAADAEAGNNTALDASQVLLELSALIQIAKQKANSAAVNSKITVQAANEGTQTVQETIARMENIKQKTMETEEMISILEKYSKEIRVITETITQLADQTNLLALNAAIEAARAGEAGKGFAVVADEVRKLAEQSNRGASQVAELVNKVSEGTRNAVEVTRESRVEVEQGVVSVSKAGNALENILEAIDLTVSEISEIHEITDSEVATSEKIVELINKLASVIENTAANAQQVAASTEEATASIQTIAASSQELSAVANELKMTVDTFKV